MGRGVSHDDAVRELGTAASGCSDGSGKSEDGRSENQVEEPGHAQNPLRRGYIVQPVLSHLGESDKGRLLAGKAPDRLLIGTWNVANLGHPGQPRTDDDYGVIVELLSWFDLVTVQEVNDNLAGLRKLEDRLSATHQTLFSDAAGNDERIAFVYDPDKVRFLGKVGEIRSRPRRSGTSSSPGSSRSSAASTAIRTSLPSGPAASTSCSSASTSTSGPRRARRPSGT
jgi:hypothetical protein